MINIDAIKKAVGEQRQGNENEVLKSETKIHNFIENRANDNEIFDWCFTEHSKKQSYIDGNRNAFITSLAAFCNQYGISEHTCLNNCLNRLKQPDQNEKTDFENVIKSVYKNHFQNFGTKNYIPKNNYIEIKEKTTQTKPEQKKIDLFPVEVFPLKIQAIIYELKDKLQFHNDLIAAGILSATATAIGNSFELLHNNHTNKAILWCVSVAEKGKGKSEPQKWCKKPFHDIDYRNKKEFDKKLQLWNDYNELNKLNKEKYEFENDKPAKPETTRHLQYILGDYNPETLYRVHGINQRGILIFADEIMKWINSFDRYSKSGEQQFLNELWNGTTANYDRVANSIFIENCFVNVLGTIQTLFLKSLSANNRTIDGFLERLLYFYPDNFVKPKPSGKIMSDNVYFEYKEIIIKLLTCNYDFWDDGQIKPNRITMEYNAGIKFNQWLNDFIDKQNNTTNENERAILSKLEIYCYRFTLLLQLLTWASGEGDNSKVELQSVEGAIKMVNYFHKTALKVYSTIESKEKTEINDQLVAKYLKSIKKKSLAEIQTSLNLKNRSNVQYLLDT